MFEELKGDFRDGPAVTRACLKCHTEASNAGQKEGDQQLSKAKRRHPARNAAKMAALRDNCD